MKLSASDPEAWFYKTENDFLTIKKIIVGDDVPWDAVVFHAQQAAEKYLLVALLSDCRRHEPSLEPLRTDAERLTRLGWASRYPESPGEPEEAEGREAVQIAKRITAAIRERVPKNSAS